MVRLFANLRLRRVSALDNFAGIWIDGGGLVLLRPGLSGGGTAPAGGFLEAVTVAVHGEDADVVGEPVQERACMPLGSQHRGPVLQRQVGRDDCRAALVALGERLEQQLGAGRRQRQS